MPFQEGNNLGNRFSSDNQPDNQGRPLGVKNRATIARRILDMRALLSGEKMSDIKKIHPEIEDNLTTEEIATIMIAGNAMGGDVKSYEALMNSAYGAPKQEIENLNHNVNVLSNDPLNDPADNSTTEDISTT